MGHDPNYGHRSELSLYSRNNLMESQNFVRPRQINFLICKLCFWCASYLYGSYQVAEKCPMCGISSSNNSIESIPISNQEAFEFRYNQLHGLRLNFYPHHKNSNST